MEHKYESTARGVMEWANHELEHVGRIVSMQDPDIQYSYALSTVNGMLHLRQALIELIEDPDYATHKKDLKKTHDSVVRVIKHLIKDFNINLQTIKNFNTRRVLKDFDFLNTPNAPMNKANAPINKANVPINKANAPMNKPKAKGTRKVRRANM
jgi:hypothetical protein